MKALIRCLLSLFLCYLSSSLVFAHSRSQSFTDWQIGADQISMTFTIKSREATKLTPIPFETSLANRLAHYISKDIKIQRGAKSCTLLTFPIQLNATEGFHRIQSRYSCMKDGPVQVDINIFFDNLITHTHFAKVKFEGLPSRDYLFNQHQRSHLISPEKTEEQSGLQTISTYIELGFQHILTGYDHLLFLMVLLLLSTKLKDVIFLVSGFTLGHSITLSLATLGWVQVDTQIMESLIGFTIIITACETISCQYSIRRSLSYGIVVIIALLGLTILLIEQSYPFITLCGLALFSFSWLRFSHTKQVVLKLRPLITLFFGFIHGFGFASALTELGDLESNLFSILLGFNIGVELGQLLIVIAVLLIMNSISRYLSEKQMEKSIGQAAILFAAVGTYYFLERVLII